MVQAAVSPALLPASERQTCKQILTLRLRAAKQTRITQYLKKVKSWNTKTKKFASKQKLKSWRALKCQGGKITNNKKYLVSNPGASITQTPSVETEETAPELEIYNGMEIQNFQNFGKITYTIEMTNMKTLSKLGKSVCKVYINGTACGTGFLLFGRFILTNAHVVRDILSDDKRQLSQRVTITFEELPEILRQIPVEENLTAYRYGCDSSNQLLDYALLQLGSLENLPPGLLPPALLSKCSHSEQEGQIYIIGHPDKDPKKMGVAFIIEYEKRKMAIDKYFTENPGHLAAIWSALVKEKWHFKEMENPHLITYNTSFLHGSSGSPVFQDNCQLVSLHTGGYSYKEGGKSYSIIEYAIPIMPIVHDILCEILKNKVMQTQQKIDYLEMFSSEALRGPQDMVCMIARFITGVLLKLREDQIYPRAVQVLMDAAKGTTQRVKTQLREALWDAMDTKPSLKGISQHGLFKLANTKEEQSSVHALCRLLFEKRRRVSKDTHLNILGEDKQKRKNRGMTKGRVGREGKVLNNGLLRC